VYECSTVVVYTPTVLEAPDGHSGQTLLLLAYFISDGEGQTTLSTMQRMFRDISFEFYHLWNKKKGIVCRKAKTSYTGTVLR